MQRVTKWRLMIRDWDSFSASNPQKVSFKLLYVFFLLIFSFIILKILERCQKGIPDRMRADAWKSLALYHKRRQLPRFSKIHFADLLLHSSPHEDQISKDLHRTFPQHADLQNSDDIGFVTRLKRILSMIQILDIVKVCPTLQES